MDVLIVREGVEIPETGTRFMLARGGIMMQIDNDWVKARVPVKEIKSLSVVAPEAELRLPPLDAIVFAKAVVFFEQVFKKHGTEAAVLLHHSPELGWELTVPKQRVSKAAVHYDMEERIPGYRCVGTMHSHGSMGASHSSVDTRDEADFDGVHVTIGGLNSFPSFEMDAELTVRSFRFTLDHGHFGGVSVVTNKPEVETSYLERRWWSSSRKLFTFDGKVLGEWRVPEDWFTKVEIASLLLPPLKPPMTSPAEGTPDPRAIRYDPSTWTGNPANRYPRPEYVPYPRHEPDAFDRFLDAIYEIGRKMFNKKG
jgi:hypothetical protein